MPVLGSLVTLSNKLWTESCAFWFTMIAGRFDQRLPIEFATIFLELSSTLPHLCRSQNPAAVGPIIRLDWRLPAVRWQVQRTQSTGPSVPGEVHTHIRFDKVERVDKRTQSAAAQGISPALRERLHTIINEDPHQFLIMPLTCHLFEISTGCERRSPSSTTAVRLWRLNDRSVGKSHRGVVQTQRGEDGRHVIVVREVCIQLTTERKRRVALIEGPIRRCTFTNRCVVR
ncbi:hypothetical protein KC360_g123 [Hortaea werneckii]|nr:hypothetical protein KC360_g123 [Hortaea werneckii]